MVAHVVAIVAAFIGAVAVTMSTPLLTPTSPTKKPRL
jgi:hypothetical protein